MCERVQQSELRIVTKWEATRNRDDLKLRCTNVWTVPAAANKAFSGITGQTHWSSLGGVWGALDWVCTAGGTSVCRHTTPHAMLSVPQQIGWPVSSR